MSKKTLTQAERAKRYREKHNLLRVSVSEQEIEKLNQITEFYGWPNQDLDNSQTIRLMIHRFHSKLNEKRQALGTCKHCNEELPAGCAKLKLGGLFKGDSNCFHTMNCMAIIKLNLGNMNECD